jgi:hypothetical protein
VGSVETAASVTYPADYKSAIQQIENLRYAVAAPPPLDSCNGALI